MEETPTTLVLLPGLLNDERLWAYQAAALADEVDIRIPDLTRNDSIAAMARRVLDEVPGQFALAVRCASSIAEAK